MKPTTEEVLAWARQVGLTGLVEGGLFGHFEQLYALAYAAGAKAMKERAAKVCEDRIPTYVKNGERWLKGQNEKPDVRLKELAPNLEEAWEMEQLLKHGSILEQYTEQHYCAAAIRALGEDDE